MKIRKGDTEYTDLQGLAILARYDKCVIQCTSCNDCPLKTAPELCPDYALSHPKGTLKRLGWEIVEEEEPECEACEIHYSTEVEDEIPEPTES